MDDRFEPLKEIDKSIKEIDKMMDAGKKFELEIHAFRRSIVGEDNNFISMVFDDKDEVAINIVKDSKEVDIAFGRVWAGLHKKKTELTKLRERKTR